VMIGQKAKTNFQRLIAENLLGKKESELKEIVSYVFLWRQFLHPKFRRMVRTGCHVEIAAGVLKNLQFYVIID